MRLKKDDTVSVISGKDKGKKGKILKVYPRKNKVLVEGVNLHTHCVRANPHRGISGGIETKEALLDASNVMLFDHETGKGSRIGYKNLEDGRKIRFFKKSGRIIDG